MLAFMFCLVFGCSQKNQPPASPRKIFGAFGWKLGLIAPAECKLDTNLSFILETTNYPPFEYVGFSTLDDGRIYLIWAGNTSLDIEEKEVLLSALKDKYGDITPAHSGENGTYAIEDGYATITINYNQRDNYSNYAYILYSDNKLAQLHHSKVEAAEATKDNAERNRISTNL